MICWALYYSDSLNHFTFKAFLETRLAFEDFCAEFLFFSLLVCHAILDLNRENIQKVGGWLSLKIAPRAGRYKNAVLGSEKCMTNCA